MGEALARLGVLPRAFGWLGQTGTREITFKEKIELCYCKDSQKQETGCPEGLGVPILGHIEHALGRVLSDLLKLPSLEQGGGTKMISRVSSLPHSFCYSY